MLSRIASTYFFLSERFRFQGPSLRRDADYIVREGAHAPLLTVPHKADNVADILLREGFPAVDQGQKALNRLDRAVNVFSLAGHFDIGAPADDRDVIFLFDHFDISVDIPKQGDRMLHSVDVDKLFYHPFLSNAPLNLTALPPIRCRPRPKTAKLLSLRL